jgi:Tfp pilus assembly ATPase PilU
MVPAMEVLVANERIRELVEDPSRTREIRDAIMEGRHPYGMIGFDQCLCELVRQKLVTYDEAARQSSSPSDFSLIFRGVSGGAGGDWKDEASGVAESTEELQLLAETKATQTGAHKATQTGAFKVDRFGE